MLEHITLDDLPPMDTPPDRHRGLWRAVHVADLVAATRQHRDALAEQMPYPDACQHAGNGLVGCLLRVGRAWEAVHGPDAAGEEMQRWSAAIKAELECPPAGAVTH